MKPSSMIFTLIGDYYRHFGMEVWVGSLIKYLEEFGFNSGTVRVTLTRMSQQGLLESRKNGQKSFYRVTSKGRKRINEGTARVYQLSDQSWDGQWRIVMYSFPEEMKEQRDRFRKELQWNGFGSKESNVWISPHNLFAQVMDLIEEYEIHQYVDFYTARYDGPQTYRDFVQKAWNIDEIRLRYEQFLKDFEFKYEKMYQLNVNNELEDRQCFVQRALLVHEYRKFLFIDPQLPREMLPSGWIGEEVWNFFKIFHGFLSSKAEKFFYENLVLPENAGETVQIKGVSNDIGQI
jgi:phenylacetic acid degradation operon negative regulatory protein